MLAVAQNERAGGRGQLAILVASIAVMPYLRAFGCAYSNCARYSTETLSRGKPRSRNAIPIIPLERQRRSPFVTNLNVPFTIYLALMASFNVSAEDSSPLVTWGPPGAWGDSPDGDSSAQSYSAQSWHTTSTQGATATIAFNGTGIWLYGAKRPNYGPYSISIDGEAVQGSASSTTRAFRQLLGGKSGLPMGRHTVTLMNTGSGSSIDLDSFVFETEIGSSGGMVSNSTVDDTSSQITYLPSASDWSAIQNNGMIDNTLHFTQTGGAQAQYKFSGDAVAIYGTVSPDHANYTISMDGNTSSYIGGSNGIARVLHDQTLLYFTNDLGSGEHNLVLTANPDQAGQQNTGRFMDIDAITVYSATSRSTGNGNDSNDNRNANSQSNGNPSDPRASSPGSQPASSLSTGAVVALIVGSIVGLLLILLIIFLLLRRRRVQRKKSRMPMQSPSTPGLPIQNPDYLEAGFAGTKVAPGENPFADPEKPAFDTNAGYLSRSTSVRSYGSTYMDMPQTPRTSVVRDSYYGGRADGEDDGVQVRSDRSCAPPLYSLSFPSLRPVKQALHLSRFNPKLSISVSPDRPERRSFQHTLLASRGKLSVSALRPASKVLDHRATFNVATQTPSGPHFSVSFTANSSGTLSTVPFVHLEVSSTPVSSPSFSLIPVPNLHRLSQHRPAPQDAFFITIIVKAPVVPIISMVLGLLLIMLDYPAPFLKNTGIHRSFILRIVGLIFQAFFAVLFYQFEIRLCPALQHKPHLPTPHFDLVKESDAFPSKVKTDPFQPPYDPNLYVGELKDEEEGTEYVVLLNKFSVVPNHFLLVTKVYESQSSPLMPSNLVQAYSMLLAAHKARTPYFAFYNCGDNSGASQPHKHIQFIPTEDEDGPPIERLTKLAKIQREEKPFSLPNLPFAHHIRRLSIPTNSTPSNLEPILATAFLELLDLVISTVRHDASHPPGVPSYNVILTLNHMYLVPRRQEAFTLQPSGCEISVNALGFAGTMLVKDEVELAAVKSVGPATILRGVGCESVHDLQAEGASELDIDSKL
ncbi:hypothetical protein EW146_g4410 [Bondarzewia mesenterica]|uniref:Uncharacterized protein n=1 Tax=Bondarzewia mesenterica TaxID=1095465 RepID=A0A4S4LUL2_9AGAM|nr:hypothetical protein EW146_g4410 [Bondarzewia mesenterica]